MFLFSLFLSLILLALFLETERLRREQQIDNVLTYCSSVIPSWLPAGIQRFTSGEAISAKERARDSTDLAATDQRDPGSEGDTRCRNQATDG
jgi:hypothetical protein